MEIQEPPANPWIERRQHPRLAVPEGVVSLQARTSRSGDWFPLGLLDLSPGGVGIRGHALEGLLVPGDVVRVHLQAADRSLEIAARVAWAEPLSQGRLYAGGLQFVGVARAARAILEDIIAALTTGRGRERPSP